MTNSVPAFATPAAVPAASRTAVPRAVTRVSPRASDDGPTRGEASIGPNFSASRRFQTPHVQLHDTGVPLVNSLGVVMQPVEMDYETAAAILADARGTNLEEADTLSTTLFPDAPTLAHPMYDTHPQDVYFPASRRDDTPVIEIMPPSSGESFSGAVRVTVAKVSVDVPAELADKAATSVAANAATHPNPAQSVAERNFPSNSRYLAPVIDFASGELSVGVSMQKVMGEPDAPAYPAETRFLAPVIDIKAPAGDWDNSAYVSVAQKEVELPIMAALSIGDGK